MIAPAWMSNSTKPIIYEYHKLKKVWLIIMSKKCGKTQWVKDSSEGVES
jgi:hypothetical protein